VPSFLTWPTNSSGEALGPDVGVQATRQQTDVSGVRP
jgi:hypothetical protein